MRGESMSHGLKVKRGEATPTAMNSFSREVVFCERNIPRALVNQRCMRCPHSGQAAEQHREFGSHPLSVLQMSPTVESFLHCCRKERTRLCRLFRKYSALGSF